MNKNLKGIQSVELAGRILSAMAEAGRPMPLGMIAKAAGMSPSQTRRYLISFTRVGFVEQDQETWFYDLSWFALQLGLATMARRDIVRLGRPVVRRLRADLNHSCSMVIWGNDRPLVVQLEDGGRSVLKVVAQVGSTLPLISSAAGQIFAAFLPWEKVADEIAQELTEMPDRVKAALKLDKHGAVDVLLTEVREQGLARIAGTVVAGVNVLASPVFDSYGDLKAALVVLGFEEDLDARWDGPEAVGLRLASSELSRQLGYTDTRKRQKPGDGKDGPN